MKWMPEKMGDAPWKMGVLALLGVVLVYLAWTNLFTGGSSSPTTPAPAPRGLTPFANVEPEPQSPSTVNGPEPVRRETRAGTLDDFKPSMKRARQVAKDPTHVDPTLRLDLLARLQSAKFEGDMRSLFEFSGAAPVAVKEPKKIHPGPVGDGFIGPKPLPPPAAPPPPQPPPAIPLKFYGFVNPARPDVKSAFFLDGEDILVASEGQTIRNRYRIVRIGVNSAVVEDTQYKNQQTLPLVAEENAG